LIAVGLGPSDLVRPDFITSIDNPDVLIEDGSLQKMLKIEADKDQNHFGLKKLIDYTKKIFPSGDNNISENFIVGRKAGNEKMFYIYNRNTDSIIDIDFFPVIKHLKYDPNYIYSPTLSINERKNRIVAGMYFFAYLFQISVKKQESVFFVTCKIPTVSCLIFRNSIKVARNLFYNRRSKISQEAVSVQSAPF
jgi:hypothetical protein